MNFKNYELRNYQDEFFPEVAGLLQYLWGGTLEKNMSFFKWKYAENPYTANTLGIVCLSGSSVVGFRSFYPSRWEIGSRDNTVSMLSPTDTVIHPEHRRMGLFTQMTKMAMEQYQATDYKAFINLSSNRAAAAGNQRLGWFPMCSRTYLRQYRLSGLLQYFLIRAGAAKPMTPDIALGKFGGIEVTDRPEVEQINSVIRAQAYDGNKIRLYKDAEYLAYRFQNPKKNYIFYYLWKDGRITGYVIMKPLQKNNNAHILDYAQSDGSAVQEILRYIINNRHFGMISVWNCGLENEFLKILKRLRFKTSPLFEKIENALRGVYFLLVRPIRKEYAEKDWFIRGIDLRNIKNWQLTEFCSDPD